MSLYILKKGQPLGEIEFYSFNEEAKKMLSMHRIAQEYFDNLLERYDNHTLPKKQNTNDRYNSEVKTDESSNEPKFLKDIFIDKFKYKYLDIIKELSENHYGDYPSPFIDIDGDKAIWKTGTTHSISYLAGLFGALRELKWIREKKEGEFIQIARDTFHIEIAFSRTAFQKMKTSNLDTAYINPFLDIFKNIK